MRVFLCSSPTRELSPECPLPMLDTRNDLIERLKETWRKPARCLMIAADPGVYDRNDEMAWFYREAVVSAGLPVACFDLWDERHPGLTRGQLHGYDVIFLAGGHVPTERAWFSYIRLEELLRGFDGILIGTSAGSMNAAETVYACPECEGESEDPDYELFFPGLGLAKCMLIPHYQKVFDLWLDGRRLIDDIVRAHSAGQRFLIVPDGTYVLVEQGRETVCGEAYLMSDGRFELFCQQGGCREF